MAENALDVFADLTNRTFVASSKGLAAKPFVSPFHQDKMYFSVQPLQIDSLGSQTSAPYSILDANNYSITALVVKTDLTTLAGPLASWTLSGTTKLGSLDLNTTAMATAFTSSSTLTVAGYIFFQFDDGVNAKVTLQADITIKRSAITAGTPSELPLSRYPTFEDLAIYVKYTGNPNGASIDLPSLDGTAKTVLYTGNDKAFHSDPET